MFRCGRSSEVERQLPKLNVGGSIPPARSSFGKNEICRETLALGGVVGALKAAHAQAQFLLFVHFPLTFP